MDAWLEHTRGTAVMLQVSPWLVQFAHVAPPEPHLLPVKPALQTPTLSQQPGQLAAEHCGMQLFCAEQTLPCVVQFWHATPPVPQAVLAEPVTHVLPLQQPLGQVAALHGGGWHVLPWQTFPLAEQFWHVTPPVPHAVLAEPVTQVLPLQQPLGHVAALQADTHCCDVQTRPCVVQFWQAWPPMPHCV